MKQDIFQAIADPTRRAILTLITIQALAPTALAEKFGEHLGNMEKILATLSQK